METIDIFKVNYNEFLRNIKRISEHKNLNNEEKVRATIILLEGVKFDIEKEEENFSERFFDFLASPS